MSLEHPIAIPHPTNSGFPSGCPQGCPGCGYPSLPPHERLVQKQSWLNRRLAAWKDRLSDIKTPALQWQYRGKVCLSAQQDGRFWRFGLMRQKSLLPIPDCPAHTPLINRSMALFAGALPPARDFPLCYYLQSGAQVTLVLKSAIPPGLAWLDEGFRKELKNIGIEGLWLHLHPSAGKKVLAKNTWLLVYGHERSMDREGLFHGPRSFRQLIPEMDQRALLAMEYFLAPERTDRMVDLYCGIGAGLARWQKRCDAVMGVELDGEAVACARINAPGAVVLRGACSQRVPQLRDWAGQGRRGRRLLVVNPPRTGIEPDARRFITGEYRPCRMAYLSCSAGTLHRDLMDLEASGYEVVRLLPFDFFPNTRHVEVLALLRLLEEDGEGRHQGSFPVLP